MPIIYYSQYWSPIGTESDLEVAKYCWDKTQVLLRQQISLLLFPTSATMSLKLIQIPFVTIKPRQYLDHQQVGT